MSLYQEISHSLTDDEGLTREIYRFQGAKTLSRLDVSNLQDGSYVYFSNSLNHHMYFSIKRLKQLLNTTLLRETGLAFNSSNLNNPNSASKIKNLILSSESLDDLYSYRLVCSKSFDGLIKDNFVFNERKKGQTRYIERVDRRVYGGGYGICDEWKKLLCYLTFFSASTRISRKDILELVKNMKITGRMNKKENIAFLLGDADNYIFEINPHILSDFNKYNIIDILESILERGIALPDSELARDSKKTIKSVVDEYERGREKTLEMLGRRRY